MEDNPTVRESQPASLIVWDTSLNTLVSQNALGMLTTELQLVGETRDILVSGTTYGADVLDLATSRVKFSLMGHASHLKLAEFAAGSRLVTVSENGKILLHETDGRSVAEITTHDYPIKTASLSSDGKFLLTTDAADVSRQSDLVGRTSRELHWQPPGDAKHVIGPDSSSVLTTNSTQTVWAWDMRSDSVDEMQFEIEVDKVVFAPDSSQVLLLRAMQQPSLNSASQTSPAPNLADGWLVDLVNTGRKDIRISGAILDAQFLHEGNQICLLSSEQTIELVDSRTLESLTRIDVQTPFRTLLPSYSQDIVFTANFQEIAGWNLATGLQEWDCQTMLFNINWPFVTPSADYLMVPQQNYIEKIPIDLVDYVTAQGTRQLSEQEEQKYLIGIATADD